LERKKGDGIFVQKHKILKKPDLRNENLLEGDQWEHNRNAFQFKKKKKGKWHPRRP